MPNQGWVPVETAPITEDWCRRFVAVMRAMDPRYKPLDACQLASWFCADGPYGRDTLELHARVADTGNVAVESADMFALLRTKPNGDRSVLMLGWIADCAVPALNVIDEIINVMLHRGRAWLGMDHRHVDCVVPREMGYLPIRMLHARLLERGQNGAPDPNNFLRIVSRSVGDAQCWRVYLY
jgi:hypothetical protein